METGTCEKKHHGALVYSVPQRALLHSKARGAKGPVSCGRTGEVQCPEEDTCCPTSASEWGCCPSPRVRSVVGFMKYQVKIVLSWWLIWLPTGCVLLRPEALLSRRILLWPEVWRLHPGPVHLGRLVWQARPKCTLKLDKINESSELVDFIFCFFVFFVHSWKLLYSWSTKKWAATYWSCLANVNFEFRIFSAKKLRSVMWNSKLFQLSPLIKTVMWMMPVNLFWESWLYCFVFLKPFFYCTLISFIQ